VPNDERFDVDSLATNPHVRRTLDETGLTSELIEAGYRVAQTMVELFADLPPDHEYFRQFSFIAPEDLADYRALVARAEPGRLDQLPTADRERLLGLPFKLILARHRLGVISPELTEKVVTARHHLREHLPESLADAISFFDPAAYNRPSSIQDNIIFGKIAYGQASATARITELITTILDELDLRQRVTQVGLDAPCGVGGGRLSSAQRQKLAIARAVLKRPTIMVVYDAVAALDPIEQQHLRDMLIEEFAGRTLIWAVQHEEWAARFDDVYRLDRRELVPGEGRPDDRSQSARELMDVA
jgi:ABC-type polar amino acid transport system ATPase subunit